MAVFLLLNIIKTAVYRYTSFNVTSSGSFLVGWWKLATRMFYACALWKRVSVSSGAAKLAGPASNFASHGGPFSEERLENDIPGSLVELLMKQELNVILRWQWTIGHEDTVAKSSCVSIRLNQEAFSQPTCVTSRFVDSTDSWHYSYY